MKRTLAVAALVGLLPASLCSGQAPTLTLTLPLGVPPGQSTDVVFHGAHLAGATGVWTSFPAGAELAPDVENNGQDAAAVTYRLAVPSDAPPGVGAVRVVTGRGVSNARLLLVDSLPAVRKAGDNKTAATAQPITPPVAIDGSCDAESSDFYKFAAAAGQRISVDVFARRLGSPLDPMIQLLDSSGVELAFSDDEPSSGVDSRFTHTFAAAGEYYLVIRDIRDHGGSHPYRLRVGDFPLTSVPYPLTVTKGGAATLTIVTTDGELPHPLNVDASASVPADRLSVATQYEDAEESSWVNVLATDEAGQLEHEPNDAAEQATTVILPGAVEGRLAEPLDRDFFSFEAKQGQRMLFRGQTRSLGSPADLFLRLYNADGGVVAEAADNGSDEGTLDYTFPADGVYRLLVEDTNRRGAADRAYRVAVEPYEPGFALAVEADTLNAPQTGVFVVKVTATRRDYNGPITLAVEGAGDDCKLANQVIPEGKPETTLHVTVGPSLAAGASASIRIVGRAEIGEREFKAVASARNVLRTAFNGLPFPPSVLEEQLALGIGPVFPRFFELAAPSPLVALEKPGATVALNVQLARSNGFEDAVNVSFAGLPAGVNAAPLTIAKGQAEGTVELTSAAPLPPGKHAVRLVGSATFQHQPQQFTLDSIAIEGPPLAIAWSAAGPLVAGGKQKATLTFAGELAPLPAQAAYESGVTRAVEGPRAPEFPGFGADNVAAAFSGVNKSPANDRIVFEAALARRGDYTLEFWFFNTRDLAQPNSPAIAGYLFSRAGTPTADNARPGDHLGIGGVESSPRDRLFFYDGQSLVSGHTPLKINTWHHVAFVRSGDNVTVYLNGNTAQPEILATAPKAYDESQFSLASRSDGYGPFQGRLDEVSVFDTALAPEKVQAHHDAARSESPARDVVLADAPVAHFSLDERDGTLANSIAPPHKRLLTLAWKNLPAGLSAPQEIVLVDAQDNAEIELTAAESLAAGKLEDIVVTGTTRLARGDFTAESPPAALEVQQP